MPRALAAISLSAALAGACAAPLGMGTPESPVTVGDGRYSMRVQTEMFAPDLVAENATTPAEGEEAKPPVTPFPTMDLALIYGLSRSVDLELTLHGTWFLLPWIPSGGSLGVRAQLLDSAAGAPIDLSFAARGGGVGTDASIELFGSTDRISGGGVYAAGSVTAQLAGPVKPLVSVQLMTGHVWGSLDDPDGSEEYDARAASATFALVLPLWRGEVAPFVTFTYLDSGTQYGEAQLVSGGIRFSRIAPKRQGGGGQAVTAPPPIRDRP